MKTKNILRDSVFTAGVLAILVPATNAATIDLGWTAAGQADGSLPSWAPATNTTGGTRLWNGGSGGTKVSGTTNFGAITDWVSSPAYVFGDTSWHSGISDAVT